MVQATSAHVSNSQDRFLRFLLFQKPLELEFSFLGQRSVRNPSGALTDRTPNDDD